jgi:hypothetical protein
LKSEALVNDEGVLMNENMDANIEFEFEDNEEGK